METFTNKNLSNPRSIEGLASIDSLFSSAPKGQPIYKRDDHHLGRKEEKEKKWERRRRKPIDGPSSSSPSPFLSPGWSALTLCFHPNQPHIWEKRRRGDLPRKKGGGRERRRFFTPKYPLFSTLSSPRAAVGGEKDVFLDSRARIENSISPSKGEEKSLLFIRNIFSTKISQLKKSADNKEKKIFHWPRSREIRRESFFFERGSQMRGSSLTRGVIRISLFLISFFSFFARGTMLRHSMEEKKGKEKSVCVFWRLAKGIRREGGPFP